MLGHALRILDAAGRELGRLQVRVPQRGLVAPGAREAGEFPQRIDDLGAEQGEPLAHQDQLSVVGDVTRRRAVVDEAAGGGGHVAKGVHVGHHVVAKALLVRRHGREVDVVEVRAHLRDRLVGNRHA